MLRGIAFGFGLVLLLGHGSAMGAPELPVLIALDRCDDLDQVEVRRVFAAELGVRSASAAGPDVTQATVICQGSRVIVRVDDPVSRKVLQRSFSLGQADRQARPRLVSIAAAELVLASWAELQTNPSPQVEPEGEPPAPETIRDAYALSKAQNPGRARPTETWHETETPEDRGFRIAALVSMREFFVFPGALFGGGLRVGEERFRFISWSADALFEKGKLGFDSRYDVLTTTLGGHLYFWGQAGPLTARAGAGLRAGLSSVTGPDGGNGGVSLAPWGWPLGAASMSLKLSDSITLELSAESGFMRMPVPGRSERMIEGGWFSGQIGLGILPGNGSGGGEAEGEG